MISFGVTFRAFSTSICSDFYNSPNINLVENLLMNKSLVSVYEMIERARLSFLLFQDSR